MPRIKKDAAEAIPGKPANQGKRGGNSSFTSDLQSIRCELSSDDKKYIKANPLTDGDAFAFICDIAKQGLKFTLGFDKNGEHCIATITDLREDSPTVKHTLQGRGKSPESATSVVCYKHLHLLRGDWTQAGAMAGDDDLQ